MTGPVALEMGGVTLAPGLRCLSLGQHLVTGPPVPRVLHVLHCDLEPLVLGHGGDVLVAERHALHQAGLEEGEHSQALELQLGRAALYRLQGHTIPILQSYGLT